MSNKELTTLEFEQSIDIKDFAYEFSMKASEFDYQNFIRILDREVDYSDYTEILLRQLLN